MTGPLLVKTPCWEHQVAAFDFAWPKHGALLAMAMAAGKSKTAIDLIVNRGHQKVLIIAPKKVIEEGTWHRQFEQHCPMPYQIHDLSTGSVAAKAKIVHSLPTSVSAIQVVLVNYEASWRENLATELINAKFDLVMADECVPQGTMISTPNGDRSIETLKVGDVIFGIDHQSGDLIETTVTGQFQRNTNDRLIRVGATLATPSHPVWTADRGYATISKLVSADRICTLEWNSAVSENLPGMSERIHDQPSSARALLQSALRIEDTRCEGPSAHPYACPPSASGNRRENAPVPIIRIQCVQEWNCANQSPGSFATEGLYDAEWWERNGANRGSVAPIRSTGMADGNSGVLLQNRRSGPYRDDSDRGGWAIPLIAQPQRFGHAQRQVFDGSRLDCPPLYKYGGTGQSRESDRSHTVYNLETGTGNYFANGLLVHNCHRLSGPGSRQSMFATKIGRTVPWRLGLSGTPMRHTPLDVYAQARFLDDSVFGRSAAQFRARYKAIEVLEEEEPICPIHGTKLFHVVKEHYSMWSCRRRVKNEVGSEWCSYKPPSRIEYRNLEELNRKFYSIAFRVGDEVLDLPEKQDILRTFDLCPSAKRIYHQLSHDFYAEVESGEITVANAMVKVGKLRQATSGYTVLDPDQEPIARAPTAHQRADGRLVETIDTGKRELLEDILEDLPDREPVVVFAQEHLELDQVRQAAEHTGRSYAELSGRVKPDQLTAWKEGRADILGAQMASGSEGIDLTRARYCVMWNPGVKLWVYDQARKRQDRTTQKAKTVTYLHLIARGTVDEDAYTALDNHRDVIDYVLSLHKSNETRTA